VVPNEADVLVEQFEVIDRLDPYMEVGSFEFLEELDRHPELVNDLGPGGGRGAQ
jgi:hypothetical protein